PETVRGAAVPALSGRSALLDKIAAMPVKLEQAASSNSSTARSGNMQYPKQQLREAAIRIADNGNPTAHANANDVPRTTASRHASALSEGKLVAPVGHPTLLTPDEEAWLVQYIRHMDRSNFNLSRKDIKEKA
ncbi:hypothetical protein, partial [Enterobacter sp. 56-7]|uniref:hypothetical protein n=1 Tax=Enterobacter sp. 56-7 TaxID=1895906 RepID=UPI00257DDE5A